MGNDDVVVAQPELDVVEAAGSSAEEPEAEISADEADAAVSEADQEEDENEGEDEVDFAELTGIGVSDDSDVEEALRVVDVTKLRPQRLKLALNDEAALDNKLAEIALFDTAAPHHVGKLPFRESLSTTLPDGCALPSTLASDDIERERKFAELATGAVHAGLARLRVQGVKFRRPDDYFAQMVKSDTQMTRVKTHLLKQRDAIQGAERRRNDRQTAKNKKLERKKQRRVAQEKIKKTKDEIEADTKLRKDRVKKRARDNRQDQAFSSKKRAKR